MKRKKIFLIVLFMIVLCSFKTRIYASCSYTEISKLKSFVSNVNLSYDYYINNGRAYFNLIINNIAPNVYFVESYTGKTFTYNDTVDGEIILYNYDNFKGTIKFYSGLSQCYGVNLGIKYYKFPQYNLYYDDPLCDENRNLSLCQKWNKVLYSYSEFKEKIDMYNKKTDDELSGSNKEIEYEKGVIDKVVEFYTKYYYILLSSIILICVIIMIISSKKNKFDI